MTWTSKHDVIFLREVLVSEMFKLKPGSRERGKCLDQISDSLNSVTQEIWFKVDQRSLRDRLKKLLDEFKRKKNFEEKSSGIAPEVTELDVLLEEVTQLKKENEAMDFSSDNKKDQQEKKAADSVRRMSMERLSESKTRELEESDDDITPKRKKRNNGTDTVAYLREKNLTEIEFKKEEMEIRKDELALAKEKENNSRDQFQQMLLQQQQQNQALMMLISKVVDKF